MRVLLVGSESPDDSVLGRYLQRRGHDVSARLSVDPEGAAELSPGIVVLLDTGDKAGSLEWAHRFRRLSSTQECVLIARVDAVESTYSAELLEVGVDDLVEYTDTRARLTQRWSVIERISRRRTNRTLTVSRAAEANRWSAVALAAPLLWITFARDNMIASAAGSLMSNPSFPQDGIAGWPLARVDPSGALSALLQSARIRGAAIGDVPLCGVPHRLTVGADPESDGEMVAIAHALEREPRVGGETAEAALDTIGVVALLVGPDESVEWIGRAAGCLTPNWRQFIGRNWKEFFEHIGADMREVRHGLNDASGPSAVALEFETPDGRRLRCRMGMGAAKPDGFWIHLSRLTELVIVEQDDGHNSDFPAIVGRSEAIEAVFRDIRAVSRVDWTVLIEGETGTGKELVAREIHRKSGRADEAFVAVNCASLSDSLLASQLFGHRRGAFTGAVSDHQGVFEAAHGGTIFLDELGDISPSVQTSLLRVLEEREIMRLGESTARSVDVRVIAATHRDLNAEVAEGRFRADLLYRIRVARIHLPPLKRRRDDIPLLIERFLASSREELDTQVRALSREAMLCMTNYEWPGNVRELKAAVEYALLRARGGIIEVGDLPPELKPTSKVSLATRLNEADMARHRIVEALRETNGNRKQAAQLLGISRATLYRRFDQLGIDALEIVSARDT